MLRVPLALLASATGCGRGDPPAPAGTPQDPPAPSIDRPADGRVLLLGSAAGAGLASPVDRPDGAFDATFRADGALAGASAAATVTGGARLDCGPACRALELAGDAVASVGRLAGDLRIDGVAPPGSLVYAVGAVASAPPATGVRRYRLDAATAPFLRARADGAEGEAGRISAATLTVDLSGPVDLSLSGEVAGSSFALARRALLPTSALTPAVLFPPSPRFVCGLASDDLAFWGVAQGMLVGDGGSHALATLAIDVGPAIGATLGRAYAATTIVVALRFVALA